MKKSLLVLLTIATSGTLSLLAERTETLLDGNNWTLDGLPVLVPDCWNKIDGSDGDPGEAAAGRGGARFVARQGRLAHVDSRAGEGRREMGVRKAADASGFACRS